MKSTVGEVRVGRRLNHARVDVMFRSAATLETFYTVRGRCRIFERTGSNLLTLTRRKRGGGPDLSPMLKSLHRGPNGGDQTPGPPPPSDPRLRQEYILMSIS